MGRGVFSLLKAILRGSKQQDASLLDAAASDHGIFGEGESEYFQRRESIFHPFDTELRGGGRRRRRRRP